MANGNGPAAHRGPPDHAETQAEPFEDVPEHPGRPEAGKTYQRQDPRTGEYYKMHVISVNENGGRIEQWRYL